MTKQERVQMMNNLHPNYYYQAGTVYTFKDNVLIHNCYEDEWVEVDIEHCVYEGFNLYKVFNHFNRAEEYTKILLKILNRR